MWILMLTLTAQAEPPYGSKEAAVAHMRGHFDAATRGVWGVARGDLDAVHEAAEVLDHRTKDIPVTWFGKVGAMQSAARRLVEAETLQGAAARLDTLAESCAHCHESVPDGPTLSPEQQTMSDRTPESDHARAWYWLWLGLAFNDDAAWSSGAQALGTAPEKRGTADKAKAYAKLGERARAATADERAFVFRQTLTSCSSCHAVARVRLDAEPNVGMTISATPGSSGPPSE